MEKTVIIENSKEVFEVHKKEKKVIATTDGNYFLESAKNLAYDHARSLGTKAFEITKEEAYGISTPEESPVVGEATPKEEAPKEEVVKASEEVSTHKRKNK